MPAYGFCAHPAMMADPQRVAGEKNRSVYAGEDFIKKTLEKKCTFPFSKQKPGIPDIYISHHCPMGCVDTTTGRWRLK
jgi:hypothetical protein